MRALIFAALLAAGPALAGQRILADSPETWMRLYDSPCVHGGTLGKILPQWRAKFSKAEASVNGTRFYACWIVDEDGDVYFLLEDGRDGFLPLRSFKDEPGA